MKPPYNNVKTPGPKGKLFVVNKGSGEGNAAAAVSLTPLSVKLKLK